MAYVLTGWNSEENQFLLAGTSLPTGATALRGMLARIPGLLGGLFLSVN